MRGIIYLLLDVLVLQAPTSLLFASGLRRLFNRSPRLEDRTTEPIFSATDQVEKVVDLDLPPGNVAVSNTSGQVFFTFHPVARPDIHVAKLVVNGNDGDVVVLPFPNADFQENYFVSPLSLRIDRFNRLWVLDYANYARRNSRPFLVAFDLDTETVVFQHIFSVSEAGEGSFLNDFQVSPDGNTVIIVDTGFVVGGGTPAIVIVDVETNTARRVLDNDDSVKAVDYTMYVGDDKVAVLGIIPIQIALDSVAMDTRGEYLYYKPLTGGTMYRLLVSDLTNTALTTQDLSQRIEIVSSETTMSDGITIDIDGNIYLSDFEHFAITRLNASNAFQMDTLLKDERFRWPDGFSFGPDGFLYFTCSSLQDAIPFSFQSRIRRAGPFQIFRFKPGVDGIPGH